LTDGCRQSIVTPEPVEIDSQQKQLGKTAGFGGNCETFGSTREGDRVTTLDNLLPGQQARIVKIDGHDSISARLREMGFVPGQAVQFLKAAPLGDPLRILVQGSRIAVRSGEARRVQLEPVTAG